MPHVLGSMLDPLQQTQLGLKRCTGRRDKQAMQDACGERLAQCLHTTDKSHVCNDIDKIFCSSWLDNNNVLVGTKCNKLRQLHVPSRTWQDVPYPAQPVHRQGPDLLASANRTHCGQHGLAVSPSGTYCVTGGTAAEDILLWRLQDGSGPSNRASMQPVQAFMGHADWVFDLDWLSDRHWVSGGRDGTIKLWQVPETAAALGSTYSTDPGSALLSVGFHGGKVRAISFDQQQQQVVALATDCSLSWWAPDLQLRGSARLGLHEPVALAVDGPLVAVGGDGTVLLLDIREPCGTKRSHSSSSHSPVHKRSRLLDGAGLARQPDDLGAAAEGAAADAEALGAVSGWLPQAYPWLRPTAARPMVLAVTGALPGMQGLQDTFAVAGWLAGGAGMDPVLAELVLRQEAASLAVARGQPFDTVLQGLVRGLLQLRPTQQMQELSRLQHKFMPESSSLCTQQLLLRPASTGQQAAQPQAMAGDCLQAQINMTSQAIHELQQQSHQLQQQMAQDALDNARAAAAAAAVAEEEQELPLLEGEELSESSDDFYDDEDEEPSDPGADVEGMPEGQDNILSLLLSGLHQPPAVNGMQGPAALQQLPNAVRYALSRYFPLLPMQQQPLPQQLQQPQQPYAQGGLVQARELRARLQGSLVTFGTVVRSISIHNDVILGVGHNSMDFHDLRYIRSNRSLNLVDAPGTSLLTRFEVPASRSVLHPALLQHGLLGATALAPNPQPAVYTHCWDPSGTHVLAAGGPLAVGYHGASMQLLT